MFLKNRAYFRSLVPPCKQVSSVPINFDLIREEHMHSLPTFSHDFGKSRILNSAQSAEFSHVVMAIQSADVTALWVVHTYTLDGFDISPRLGILSPEPRCGKTTLTSVLKHLVHRGQYSANISPSSFFRVAQKHRPTLIIDEVEELRGVLNSGHRCDGEISRCVGDDHEPRQFSTYSACAIALIGKLPDTLADRATSIELRRRLPNEPIRSLRIRHAGHLDLIARKIARWVADNGGRLNADPEMPAAVFNRAADNWCPLVAISDRPWANWNHGKGLNPSNLAKYLKGYGIKSKNVRIGDSSGHLGYNVADFSDAFSWYLRPASSATWQRWKRRIVRTGNWRRPSLSA